MSMSLPFVDRSSTSLPVQFVGQPKWRAWLREQSAARRGWIESSGMAGNAGDLALLPGRDGKAAGAVLVLSAKPTLWDFGALATKLPAGTWRLSSDTAPVSPTDAAVAIGLGAWRFERYRSKKGKAGAKIIWPQGADKARATAMIEAIFMARDLITTPSSDMGPAELAEAAQALGKAHKARVRVIVGDDLLKQNYPMVHAVGRASSRAPRLIDLVWGRESDPKVTLVGKGVCFDTGGLDLKPSGGMLLMKKDMGGAANVLALAQMVMDAKLKLRLRVLIPAVENAVAGNAFRPLDVFTSRKGLTVEIGNTDAEGRLVLADALALADEEKPDLLIDLGTLTGAARVALGPDLPPFYTNDESLAGALSACAKQEHDPLWRLPLWPAYDSWLDSKVANINNAPSGGFAGSITCALFLQRFVEAAKSWLHVDIYGWTPSAKPGRPEGGECQAARAIYRLLSNRYGR
jgi:leucyl aminopeptidase